MPKSWIRWQLNSQYIPADPEEKTKLWASMLERVKADLKAGMMTEWGNCYDGSGGYGLSELSVPDLFAYLGTWMPYVEFDVKPVLTADESLEAVKKVAAAAKAK